MLKRRVLSAKGIDTMVAGDKIIRDGTIDAEGIISGDQETGDANLIPHHLAPPYHEDKDVRRVRKQDHLSLEDYQGKKPECYCGLLAKSTFLMAEEA